MTSTVESRAPANALDQALAAARAVAAARRAERDEIDAQIEKLKKSNNTLKNAAIDKLTQRRAELAKEVDAAAALVQQLETASSASQEHDKEIARLKKALSDSEAKNDASLRDLRLMQMRREQELTEKIDAKERELRELRDKLEEEKQRHAKELQAVRAEMQRVETNAMTVLAERANEIQELRQRVVAASTDEGALRAEIAQLREIVEMLTETVPPTPAAEVKPPSPARNIDMQSEKTVEWSVAKALLEKSAEGTTAKEPDEAKEPEKAVIVPLAIPPPPGLPPPPPVAVEKVASDVNGREAKQEASKVDDETDEGVAPPETRVKALPILATVSFTSDDDKELATAIDDTPTTIADIATRAKVEVRQASERIWEFVSLGFVEVVE